MSEILPAPSNWNLVAIYAALLSTMVFGWQVVTHLREGARLRVRASPNMKTIGGGTGPSNETYIVINAVNVGTADTTITHVIYMAYDSWWAKLRGRPSFTGIVPHPSPAQPIPFVLEVGRQYMAMCTQDASIEKISREKRLYVGVCHAFSRRYNMVRLKPIESPKE